MPFAVCIGMLCATALQAPAATWYVATNSASDGGGTAWSNAFHTIQGAVDAAGIDDTIWVTDGVYATTAPLVITNRITLQSVHGPQDTFIVAQTVHRCIQLGPGASFLTGFTISNGFAAQPIDYHGGGVLCTNNAPVVSNCVFTANRARYHGGGMYQGTATHCLFRGNNATLRGGGLAMGTADHCTFNSNSADYGGGMYQGTASDCLFTNNHAFENGGGANGTTATDCTFITNLADYGGGMYLGTATRCTFTGNSTLQHGGGANAIEATQCAFLRNSGDNGGGMSGGSATRCIFSGNFAKEDGGGMSAGMADDCQFSSNAADFGGGMYRGTATHCTFRGNSATWYGGGLDASTSVNCIVWFNTAVHGYNNLHVTDARYTCTPDVTNGIDGNLTADPQFAGPGDDHLMASSPCIDTGSNLSATPYDLDGIPRPLDSDGNGTAIVDMGCYELLNRAADSDGDTMPDGWEQDHGLNAAVNDATNNSDSDPFNNLDEYVADTQPTNGLSYFHLTAITNDTDVTLCFPSSSNRLYTLYERIQMKDEPWSPVPGGGPRAGAGGADSMPVSPASPTSAFYRMTVKMP